MDYANIKKISLWGFIGFLGLTALIAILSVLSGSFGEFQLKVLATTFSISAASVCSMASAAFMQKRKLIGPGLVGIGLAAATAVFVLVGVWAEIGNEGFWKTTITLITFTIACAHAFLLALPDLAKHYRWSQGLAAGTIGLLALQITGAVWGEIGNEGYYRLLAVVAIVLALQTLVIPNLMKLSQERLHPRKVLKLENVEGDTYCDASGKTYQVIELASELHQTVE